MYDRFGTWLRYSQFFYYTSGNVVLERQNIYNKGYIPVLTKYLAIAFLKKEKI